MIFIIYTFLFPLPSFLLFLVHLFLSLWECSAFVSVCSLSLPSTTFLFPLFHFFSSIWFHLCLRLTFVFFLLLSFPYSPFPPSCLPLSILILSSFETNFAFLFPSFYSLFPLFCLPSYSWFHLCLTLILFLFLSPFHLPSSLSSLVLLIPSLFDTNLIFSFSFFFSFHLCYFHPKAEQAAALKDKQLNDLMGRMLQYEKVSINVVSVWLCGGWSCLYTTSQFSNFESVSRTAKSQMLEFVRSRNCSWCLFFPLLFCCLSWWSVSHAYFVTYCNYSFCIPQGEYGLSEAVQEIKDYKAQIRIRDQ